MDHGKTALELFQSTGAIGLLIVLATPALLLAGIVFTVVRMPRIVAILFLAASLLAPVGLGTLGYFTGRVSYQQVLASLKAPTPRDAAGGERESQFCLVMGLGSGLLCYTVALAAFARSKEPSGDPGRMQEAQS